MKTSAWVVLAIILTAALAVFLMKRETPLSTINTDPLIRLDSPVAGSVVTSPLTITGEARGNWYFEASFPIKILDANGTVLGQHYAEAQSDWMTTEFVPFVGTLEFAPSTTETGTLVLEKDNPSGLRENDDSRLIPIRFGQVATNTRTVKLYLYNEAKDKDTQGNILCSSQGLEAVERKIPLTITPIQDVIRLLIKELGLTSVTLNAASVTSGTLTLTFSDPLNQTGGGSCRVSILRAEIEATAKQFSEVKQVRLMPEDLFQP